MATQQQATTSTSANTTAAATATPNSYPILESSIAPLDECDSNMALVRIEKDLVGCLKELLPNGNLLDDIADKSILPIELFTSTKRMVKPKVDPIKRLNELPTEEAEEEEEQEDEEEDEEQEVVEDEEDDAGGDYLVSHFDNGENYEDNDDEGDDMTSMI